jgi:tetratricopeptide (TPR) repeat protein
MKWNTNSLTKSVAVLIICLTFIHIPLKAQDSEKVNYKNPEPTESNTYAIIIGINKYKNISPLDYASVDAASFYNLLQSPVFNIKQQNLHLLIDSSASRSNIYKEMYELEEILKPNDLLIFYFAGHGDIEAKIQTNNSLLLLPQSPSINYLRSGEYLDMNTIRDYFISLTNKKVRTYFVCDACHSGNLTGGMEGQRLTSLNLQQSWANEVKLLSCQSNELSQEGRKWGNGRGVFTYFLDLALQGMADNGDGKITLGEIKRYMETEVASSTNDKQNPVIIGDPKKFIVNVNKDILAKVKNNLPTNVGENVSMVNTTRGVLSKVDGLMTQFQTNLKFNSELFFINESVIETAALILKDNSASRYWPTIESQLYDYCNQKFDRIVTIYYNGKPLNSFTHDINDLKKFMADCLFNFKNKFFYKEIYVKYKFLQILSAGIGQYELNPGAALQFENTLLKLKSLSPASPFIYKKLSEVLLASGKFDKVLEEISNYLLLLPNDAYAYNFSGMTLFYLKENDKAVESLLKAIWLKPNFSDAYYNLGIVYSKMGRKDEAREAFNRANKFK